MTDRERVFLAVSHHRHHPISPCYRVEPLVMEHAERRRPVFAAYARGGKRLGVGLQVPPPWR